MSQTSGLKISPGLLLGGLAGWILYQFYRTSPSDDSIPTSPQTSPADATQAHDGTGQAANNAPPSNQPPPNSNTAADQLQQTAEDNAASTNQSVIQQDVDNAAFQQAAQQSQTQASEYTGHSDPGTASAAAQSQSGGPRNGPHGGW